MFEIGKITTTHGIRGEIKIYNKSDFNRFEKGKSFYVLSDHTRVDLKIQSVRAHKNSLIIKLKDYDSINDVLKYVGLTCYSDEKIALKKDEFSYQDLIGKKVYTNEKVFVGEVTSIVEVPQGHLIEVFNGEKKVLIPFVKAFVSSIDEDIIINPIEGLI